MSEPSTPMLLSPPVLLTRRALMVAGLLLPAWAARARTGREVRVALLGQSLVQQVPGEWLGRQALAGRLRPADAVFTDLETAIAGAASGTPTRGGEVLHAAAPEVIDLLRDLGVTLVTTANNHAWDLGTSGVVAALQALDARGIAHAGSGLDLASASAAARLHGIGRAVSLVAAAAGAIREGAAATATRPGVNELRRDAAGALDRDDVARTLDAIRAARRLGGVVIACLHNHYWEPDPATTPEWQRGFARQCVDAGASIFIAHGPPLLQGIERYKGTLLLHGLGSFIFQTRKAAGSYGPAAWQSLLVEARFRDGSLDAAIATPLQLDQERRAWSGEFTSGLPAIASKTADAICRSVVTRSAALGFMPKRERRVLSLQAANG